MKYFWDTTETIAHGLGFSHFGPVHLCWLGLFLIAAVAGCIWYGKMGTKGRTRWNKTIALTLVVWEVMKICLLLLSGRFEWTYLPLHLCGINIFLIAVHAWKPSKLLSNFLYTVCIPGALAALLFPNWTALPLANIYHIHSSLAHILLVMYPLVQAVNGELKPCYKMIPKCLGLLVLMATPIYGLNLLLGTNFMFLMSADAGNPLYWFEQNWGNHLLGFPVIIAGVLIVMYLPMELQRKLKKDKKIPKID